MIRLSVVPKDLGKETIKSNSCGDANSSDIHSVEDLLVDSVLCVQLVSRPGRDMKTLQIEGQRDTPSLGKSHL